MKIQSKKISKKPFVIAAAIVSLLAVATLTYVYALNGNLFGWNNNNTSSNDQTATNLDKPTKEQIKAGNDIKNQNANKNNSNSDTPPTPVSQSGSNKENVEIIITAKNQDQGSGVLQVRAQISAVVSTGQCTLTMSKAGQTVTKTAGIQGLASTSTCKGFDIPVSELSPGLWQSTLTYENDALTGSASEVITIQ